MVRAGSGAAVTVGRPLAKLGVDVRQRRRQRRRRRRRLGSLLLGRGLRVQGLSIRSFGRACGSASASHCVNELAALERHSKPPVLSAHGAGRAVALPRSLPTCCSAASGLAAMGAPWGRSEMRATLCTGSSPRWYGLLFKAARKSGAAALTEAGAAAAEGAAASSGVGEAAAEGAAASSSVGFAAAEGAAVTSEAGVAASGASTSSPDIATCSNSFGL